MSLTACMDCRTNDELTQPMGGEPFLRWICPECLGNRLRRLGELVLESPEALGVNRRDLATPPDLEVIPEWCRGAETRVEEVS